MGHEGRVFPLTRLGGAQAAAAIVGLGLRGYSWKYRDLGHSPGWASVQTLLLKLLGCISTIPGGQDLEFYDVQCN